MNKVISTSDEKKGKIKVTLFAVSLGMILGAAGALMLQKKIKKSTIAKDLKLIENKGKLDVHCYRCTIKN